MLLKHLISITLALASFSVMAGTTEASTTPDKASDTTQTEKTEKPSSPSDEKSADTTSTTEKKADATPSSETAEDTASKEKGGTINITVTTSAKDVAGIGFFVDGNESGEAGSSHTGVGPSNKTYSFGYRKHPKIHENIKCGTAQLSKDSHVTLIAEGESCHLKVD